MGSSRSGEVRAALVVAVLLVVFNEWTVAAIFAPDGRLNLESAWVVRVVDVGLLLWLGIAARRRATIRVATLAYLGFVGLIVTCAAEVTLSLALRFPATPLAAPLRPVARDLYPHWMRMIQFDPDCSRFDSELSYTLRPGSCEFSNFEFATTVTVNSAGLRDDEESLDAPEIIVLGDSVAMGWGVQQNETFTELLQRRTGRRALNAGISSYGTARELTLLRRLDTSNLRALVIQYCDNDLEENRAFLEAGDRVHVISEKDRRNIIAYHRDETTYWPGMYLKQALRSAALTGARRLSELVRGTARWRRDREQQASDDAAVFLRVLASLPPPGAPTTPVFVFDGCLSRRRESGFAARLLETQDQTPASPAFLTVIHPDLGAADRFLLDDHPNAGGHQRIADALVAALAERDR